MLGFNFEEDRLKHEITRLGARRVLLQMPQGLKPAATQLAQLVESCGALSFIMVDPCYGACDIAQSEAEHLGVDLIVHFGHTQMVNQTKIPTLYIETHANIQITSAVQQAIPLLLAYNKIGLTTSIQHIESLNSAKQLLTNHGKTVLIGDAGQLCYAGQLIGCNYSNAKTIATKVDAFLFIGGGIFHALGVALSTDKPTIIADPYDNRAYPITDQAQRLLKQRYANLQAAKDAKTVGILVGLKLGQKHLTQALDAKAAAEKSGRLAVLLAGRELTPEALMDFPNIDAYINTACPRISLDTPSKFQKPTLTINEFMVLCGEISWIDMLKKGLFEN
ncbi:MAG: diphthamide biosynthesis enzyme Dph2 [Nitrososphaerota archaeon]|uniref:diphthamide biosynthesis enzyme Dph2 n=1 Tax=Candidatus Bathycorpusculum sp. TaxID=2994959 RepID=UPI00282AA3D1|nr:diphthamide biosynthesis enzyme Dph2 [Candidatus Termitimicrobium sp.]MCL2432248.1 diphthamide biosynthesis enzyme Dph2 [Candidatus Termitimicrobium sp.]MDR0492057.1 diphthamide biosynthesis enzyme Dph2 [Nitrososphaerota archaeon]